MGQWRAKADIPATRLGPAAARQVIATLLAGWHLAPISDEAQLVVSELVTNAIQHAPAADSVELELVAHADRLRISIADRSAIRPVVADLAPSRPRGRGMRIVQGLATQWGAEAHHGGKRVWVELAVSGQRGHGTRT